MVRIFSTILPGVLVGCLLFGASATVSAETRTEKAIPYSQDGDDRNLTSLDIYAPKTGSELPVMVWIHGGAWKIGDKARVEKKPEVFNDHGFVFVSINYRLHPVVNVNEQATDVAKAIRWVHDHIQDYGGSPEKMFLMGHSAGAHLAALVATDQRYLEAEKLNLNRLQGVVLLDGAAYDVPRQLEISFLPRLKNMYRSVFTEDAKKQTELSPITHVSQGKGIPPFLILHVASRRDGTIQSQALGKKMREAGVLAKVVAAENKTHGTINREIGQPGDVPTEEIFEFLAERAKAAR